MSFHRLHCLVALCVPALCMLPSADADDPDASGIEQAQGAVLYRSGGIGSDESTLLKSARADYPLDLSFSSPQNGRSVWESDVSLRITDAKAAEVLNLPQAGPIVLVKLPPGHYRIEATLRGRQQTRDVVLTARHQAVALQWPAGPEGLAPPSR